MEYQVRVTEFLEKDIFVLAETKDEAVRIVNQMYRNAEIILDADDYKRTDIKVVRNA